MRIIVILACVLVLGCQQTSQNETNEGQNANKTEEVSSPVTKVKKVERSEQWQIAKVKYFELEGGFYGLVTTTNKRYLPLNLPTEFKQHMATVRFNGKTKLDVNTIQQWGTPFEISNIELIEKGQSKSELSK